MVENFSQSQCFNLTVTKIRLKFSNTQS